MKARYLTYFSYIGTHFRSSEKLWPVGGVSHTDTNSVQGLMEIGFLRLQPLNYPKVWLSSRTDGGVHALNATAHVDLERPGSGVYDPQGITLLLNKFFYKNNHPIAINKCLRVSDEFSGRREALSRTYLYRLAVIKKNLDLSKKTRITSIIPIEEWRRCHFVNFPAFDIEKFREAAAYLPGIHDFGSFKKFDKLRQYKHNRRLLHSVDIRESNPLVTSHTRDNKTVHFHYWDIYFHGSGFVHNQIRRMMGALLGVATGIIPVEEIQLMLQVPSKHSWPTNLQSCPPHGLYLCDIEYNVKDLVYVPENVPEKI